MQSAGCNLAMPASALFSPGVRFFEAVIRANAGLYGVRRRRRACRATLVAIDEQWVSGTKACIMWEYQDAWTRSQQNFQTTGCLIPRVAARLSPIVRLR